MIDVMKRLAELDSRSPTLRENQQVEECGMMGGMMGGMPERPPMPASINMTAGSGEELSDMLATIMQLAGVKQYGQEAPMGAEPMGNEPQGGKVLALEPVDEPGDSTSDMRSMIDKLNPMGGDDDVSASHGDVDNDGDHDMDDHNAEKDEKETDEGQYNNKPNDPRRPPPFKANQFAHQENQPGQGDRMDGTMPKATMEEKLMADYQAFLAEGVMDTIKGLAARAMKALGGDAIADIADKVKQATGGDYSATPENAKKVAQALGLAGMAKGSAGQTPQEVAEGWGLAGNWQGKLLQLAHVAVAGAGLAQFFGGQALTGMQGFGGGGELLMGAGLIALMVAETFWSQDKGMVGSMGNNGNTGMSTAAGPTSSRSIADRGISAK